MEPQYWLLAGVFIGIGADFLGRWLFEKVFGPKIRIPKEDKDVWWAVLTDAKLAYFETPLGKTYLAESPVPRNTSDSLRYGNYEVTAYRLKVKNEGRHAAENVAGTVKFETKGERRICWYEGAVATITLNAEDHSFLDVYGAVLHSSGRICMPTENGWQKLYSVGLKDKVKISLRVTAKNAKPYTVHFEIDPVRLDDPNYRPQLD